MTSTRIAVAITALLVAGASHAAPSMTSINLLSTSNLTTTGSTSNTGGASAWCFDSSSSPAGGPGTCSGGGSQYGNTYKWTNLGGNVGSLTASAFGGLYDANTNFADDKIAKAWLGNYGTPNGFGVTSQNTGELVSNGTNSWTDNAAPSQNPQHTNDNVSNYESMLFSFGSAVTLNSVSIGFKGDDADATVWVYNGAGDPTAALQNKSLTYGTLASNGWVLAGNYFNMQTGVNNVFTPSGSAYAPSKYWMVGAYASVGTNIGSTNDTVLDSFKINGLQVTAVPEPDSVALFGIAALGVFLARRRKARAV